MSRKTLLVIERKPELLKRVGISRSTLHNKIQQNLWCPPVSLGARAIGFFQHETDELLTAYANSFTESEIRNLVAKLVEERRQLMGVNHG